MFIYKSISGACVKTAAPKASGANVPPAPAAGGRVTIRQSVGQRGRNAREDVLSIQSALVRVPAHQGGPGPTFAVDGTCGPKTIDAIRQFQLKQFGWGGADGLVEPDRQTLARLNELTASTAPAQAIGTAVTSGGLTPAESHAAIALAQRWIVAAQANLIAAVPFIEAPRGAGAGLAAFSRDERMRLLNKHFQIDGYGVPRQRVQFILNVFDRMRQVFQRPAGMWGESAFVPDPLNTPGVAAYTWWGGFFRGGQTRTEAGHTIRLDTIYLCPGLKGLTPDIRSFVVIHELAHFVGHPEFIDDHAYNFQGGGSRIRRLTPPLRQLNAESYANFAFEVARGQDAPRF